MTSLALLPHATRAAAPPFNANFFIVAATVIPVLFLALAVQGRTYENLVKAYRDLGQRRNPPAPFARALAARTASVIAGWTAAGILSYGAVSEDMAVYALYQQRASSITAQSVLSAVTVMVVMTVAGPALALLRAMWATLTRGIQEPSSGHRDTGAQPETARLQEAAAGPTPPGEKAETGKTDPA